LLSLLSGEFSFSDTKPEDSQLISCFLPIRGSFDSSGRVIPSYFGYGCKNIRVRNPMENKKILENRRQYSHPQLKEFIDTYPNSCPIMLPAFEQMQKQLL